MPEQEAVQIARIDGRAVVRVQSWPPNRLAPAFVAATVAANARVLDLGPEEWWVVSDTMPGAQLREHLMRYANPQSFAVVDLSQGFAVLKLWGSPARELLMKGCGVDLDSSNFPVDHCTRTRLGQLHITLNCTDETPAFELYVGRSYAGYLESWLNDSALEFTSSNKRGEFQMNRRRS